MKLIELVLKFITEPWDWECLSRNPSIQFKDVFDHLDKPWDWYYISSHLNLSMDIVTKNPSKPWDMYSISRNPSLTVDSPLNIDLTSTKPNLIEMIEKHPANSWNWEYILI